MSTKKVIIYVVVSIVIGVIMGGISKLFDVDLSIFPFIIPVVIFSALSGGTQAMAKKKNNGEKDDNN